MKLKLVLCSHRVELVSFPKMKHSNYDISESELDDYVVDVYERLKDRVYKVRVSTNRFRCPFCGERERKDYLFDDIVQHARRVGKGSRRDGLKLKGKHIALEKFLLKYYSPRVSSGPSRQSISQVNRNDDEKFVWPWKGIVANIPVELKDGRYVGDSGSKLRDELARKGFNPLKVRPLWSPKGHSGFAIVDFNKDILGFDNARSFEKDFELSHCGKKEFNTTRSRGDKLFGWMAREDDYNSSGLIGKHLRDNGDLKTLADIESEDKRKDQSLVSNLAQTLVGKDKQEKELQNKLRETCASLEKVMKETDKMTEAYNAGIQTLVHNPLP